jgi:hypothetical protein
VTTADSIELKRFRALKTLRDFDSVRCGGRQWFRVPPGSEPQWRFRGPVGWALPVSAQGFYAVGEASKSLTLLDGIHMRHGPDAAYLVSEDEVREWLDEPRR